MDWRTAFDKAYQAWREALCDVDPQGLPFAPGSGDDLFDAFLRELDELPEAELQSVGDETTRPAS